MPILKKLFLVAISGGVFVAIINLITPPISWNQASIIQILIFFVPLLIFLTSLFDLFFNYLPRSFVLASGVIFLVVLQSINLLNPVTALVIFIFTVGLVFFFNQEGLTIKGRVSKITRSRTRK